MVEASTASSGSVVAKWGESVVKQVTVLSPETSQGSWFQACKPITKQTAAAAAAAKWLNQCGNDALTHESERNGRSALKH